MGTFYLAHFFLENKRFQSKVEEKFPAHIPSFRDLIGGQFRKYGVESLVVYSQTKWPITASVEQQNKLNSLDTFSVDSLFRS